MAQFIAICRRSHNRFAETDFTPELLAAEAEQVRRLYSQGVLRAAWGHQSPAGAVLLLEAESREAAEATIATLPLQQREMLDVELLLAAPYRGFGPSSV